MGGGGGWGWLGVAGGGWGWVGVGGGASQSLCIRAEDKGLVAKRLRIHTHQPLEGVGGLC